ncbi:MAG: YcxB family protein [Ruminococcaceae bacterium]|jgi:hypothetical protein|nr:YcxB family protein [Oscillospiraceae bacterium]
MPTFYEGEPMEALEQTIRAEDYASAFYAAVSTASLWNRREIKAGICATLAVFCASIIPVYRMKFSTFFGPICGILAFLGLAAVFFFLQPADIKNGAKRAFESNQLLALPQKVRIYRDSIVVESERECFTEYWTDFARCVEIPGLVALVGGRERFLLIVKKDGLDAAHREMLSAFFADAFASRYQKFG